MVAMLAVTDTTACLSLDEPAATDPSICGAKAASLAAARAAGLPVMPGFVITTKAHLQYLDAHRTVPPQVAEAIRAAWETVSRHGADSLVVRSSSTIEDAAASSMAGRFRSVLNVRGWAHFLEAVGRVLASADEVGGATEPSPMAVLVQPFLVPQRSGVLFGVDPISGDARRIVVEAVAGGPDELVSGRVSAQHYLASAGGTVLAIDHRPYRRRWARRDNGRLLSNAEVRALARLAARAGRVFGQPQDIEWAYTDGLLLLQSRPVTATGTATHAAGPVLGPGPVAETFPDPLSPLESDLWVSPMRTAMVAALSETRAVARGRLDRSPVMTTVRGRVAVDLELFGYEDSRPVWALLDPRPSMRRLAASWHVGMVRALLPSRAEQLAREVDDRLATITLRDRTEAQLLDLLDECAVMLERLQHDEVLAATLLPPVTRTAAAAALDVLSQHADDHISDDALVQRYPVLLSLIPPAIGVPLKLPPAAVPMHDRGGRPDENLEPREALRLRARWVQELTARAAWVLGQSLASRGVLDDASSVTLVDRGALRALIADGGHLPDLHERQLEAVSAAFSPPLPPQFRLTPDGDVVPAARAGARPDTGVGAGGGRGTGPAAHGSVRNPPAAGDVLVVRDLQPGLAAWLPGLAGLVAETGGTLSHLAILAREFGVPTVVGVHDALARFPPGVPLVVDGSTGEVSRLDTEQSS